MQLCVFEDINYNNFEPMVFSRPVYDLICGIDSLKNKIIRSYKNTRVSLHCRPYLADIVRRDNPGFEVNKISDDQCLFINGRIIAPSNIADLLPLAFAEDKVIVNGETVIAAYLSGENLDYKKNHLNDLFSVDDFNGLPVKILDLKCANYLWDLINYNGSQIQEDFLQLFLRNGRQNFINTVNSPVHLLNEQQVFIGQNVTLKPGVVLDASNGPVIIDDNAFIYPNSVVIGPVYIGSSAVVKSGANIYEDVTISKGCKVGGEVGKSILMPYSNKQHTGFLGEAYLGSWVNLGADTSTSDLKNNYSKIKIHLSGKEINTGLQFLGPMIGDHTKTAIGTTINTGTVVGFSCNLFGSGFPDKYIPSFTWVSDDGNQTYNLDKAIETAKVVMARRNVNFDAYDEKLFRIIFELTQSDREKRGY